MKKKGFILMGAILFASLFLYFLSNFFGKQDFSNFISPVITICNAVIIFSIIKERELFRTGWILAGIASLLWGVIDLIWMWMYNFAKINPEDSFIVMNLYLLPNLLILSATLIYFIQNMKKWHKFQLLIDGIVAFIGGALIIWDSLIVTGGFFKLELVDMIVQLIFITSDTLMFVIAVILISSARVNKLSTSMKATISGVMLFVITDLTCAYAIFQNEYNPNQSIDNFYVLSLSLFGIASLMDAFLPNAVQNPEFVKQAQNIGQSYRLMFFLIIPITMTAWGLLHFEILVLLIFIAIAYILASGFVQISIKNEDILKKEVHLNEKLEKVIETRTQELLLANAQLEKSVDTDFLSGMNNRHYFTNKIDELIENGDKCFSIYYMDLDRFKIINDIHGHDMGDRVLKEVSTRFLRWQAEDRLISRIGGDEFALIRIHGQNENEAVKDRFCEELLGLFKKNVEIDGYAFEVNVSIGVAIYPQDAKSRELLIKYADIAMYQAKRNHGEEKCIFYSAKQGEHIQRRSRIEYLLKTINYDEEFTLNYQPQVRLNNVEIVGIEALLRWNNSELGNVPPGEFIQIAEETDCIIKIGKWVIENAFKQIAQWNLKYSSDIKIGINLSPLQFDSVDLLAFVKYKIDEYKVNPAWLNFEITENSAADFGSLIKDFFGCLTKMGARFSIDDFGTGYSSLSYISSFDINQLKIAKELIDHIVEKNDKRLIIKAIILMAKGMNIITIAEGVETQEQINVLKELGCDIVQGYFYSRPLTKEDLEERYLSNN